MIIFEQPLNERIRTLMRLEFLFAQAEHTRAGESVWDSRATLTSIIDILNVFGRSDLKGELLKELERLSANLARLERNPKINRTKLNTILEDLDTHIDRLHSISGQIGQELRGNEFLSSIRQRSSIAGGTCHFDLPAYHFWLTRPSEERVDDLTRWLQEFEPLRSAINFILRLIRESSSPTRETAEAGFFQTPLDSALPFQLIRVAVAESYGCYAEISGGKHRFTIRFLEPGSGEQRPGQSTQNIDFDLICCAI